MYKGDMFFTKVIAILNIKRHILADSRCLLLIGDSSIVQ